MKNIFYLTLISIFIVPLSAIIHVAGTDVWYMQYLALFSAYCLGLSAYIWGFNKALSIFSIVSLVSAIVTANQMPRSILCLIQIYFSILGISVISKFDHKQRQALVYALLGLAFIQFSWLLLQYFNLDPIFNKTVNQKIDDTVGFSGSHNQIGVFFADMAPLVISYFPVGIMAVIFSLWCSTTTSAWIAAGISTFFLIFFINKQHVFRKITYFLIAFLSLSLVFFNKFERLNRSVISERATIAVKSVRQAISGRLLLTEIVPLFRQNDGKQEIVGIRPGKQIILTTSPWLGFGLGNFIRTSTKDYYQFFDESRRMDIRPSHRYEHVHNDYIEVFFEMGRFGLISMLLIMGDLIYKFICAEKTRLLITSFAGILAHMVSAMGIYTVHTAVSGITLIVLLGIFYGESANRRITYG